MRQARFVIMGLLLASVLAAPAGHLAARGADQPTIGEVSVVVSPHSYFGPCPANLKFTGRIDILRYAITFNYHWELSDGVKSGVRLVRVVNPNTRTVTAVDSWEIGAPNRFSTSGRNSSSTAAMNTSPRRPPRPGSAALDRPST